MKRIRLLLLSFVLVLLVVVLLVTQVNWRESVLFAAVFNNPHCGVSDGMAAYELWNSLRERHVKVVGSTRVVKTDPGAGLELRSTPRGQIWIPVNDVSGLEYVLAEQEAHIYGEGARGVQQGDIVLDCGAYVGTFSRLALDAGAKLVVAVEPVPEKVECLRRNFGAEIEAGRLLIYPKGVWDKEELLPLHKHSKQSGGDSFVLDRDTTSEELQLTTIDQLVKELRLERVDFIKMDIEGAEGRALRGGASTIRAHHPGLALAVYHLPTDRQTIPEQVRELWPGYQSVCSVCQLQGGRLAPDIMLFY
ncbi:MAG: FkbM family methyltransferase [Acidobacteria bacterium]|nr:MAG: FkbM family methyltransferase [Acidobacteriota bacterium]